MRYVLATALICALGAPAAYAIPAASTAPATMSKGEPMIQTVARHHTRKHKHRAEGRPATRSGRH